MAPIGGGAAAFLNHDDSTGRAGDREVAQLSHGILLGPSYRAPVRGPSTQGIVTTPEAKLATRSQSVKAVWQAPSRVPRALAVDHQQCTVGCARSTRCRPIGPADRLPAGLRLRPHGAKRGRFRQSPASVAHPPAPGGEPRLPEGVGESSPDPGPGRNVPTRHRLRFLLGRGIAATYCGWND